MRLHRFLLRSALAALGVALSAHSAAAQSNVFVTGTGFADIKRFDSVVYDPRVLAAASDPFSLDATGAGGGLRVATFLHPRWSLELAVDAGSATKQHFPNPYEALFPRTTLRIPELSSSTRFLSVSTVAGFHSRKMSRVQLGYLAGFSFVRATHESELPEFMALTEIGVGSVTAELILPSGRISPTIFPPLPITTRTTRRIDNAPGLVLGFEAALDVASRLAIVPEVRALAFSTTGRDVFLIRPGVGVRWSF